MKTPLLSLLSICIIFCYAFQTPEWTKLKVDKDISVTLPGPVYEMDVPGTLSAVNSKNRNEPIVQRTQAYRAEDEDAIYIIVRLPLKDNPNIPTVLAELQKFYKREADLMVAQAKGELLEHSVIPRLKTNFLFMKFRALNASGVPVVKCIASCTLGKIVYQFHFVAKNEDDKWHISQRNRYFNSISRKRS